jgi:hypothetical protein
MRITSILAAGAAAALLMTPAAALAGGPDTDHPGKGKAKRQAAVETKAGAKAQSTPPSQAKAYGKRCQGESKKHVKGQQGTPFSQCVKAMAKVASGKAKSAKAACKGLSKKHAKGKKGTPFSRCVKAARKLKAEREQTGGDESYADPFATS